MLFRAAMLSVLGILFLCLALPLLLRWWTDTRYQRLIYTPETAPRRRVAIVFGAGVWPGGVLSDVLADRVQTAAELYRLGKVEKLLLTGDNSTPYYNEPKHMRDYSTALGVPEADVVLDYAGRRTYDSCYRARQIFGVTDAILVTQAYHLDRALFTANGLGIDAVGVGADRRSYIHVQAYWWRELLATSLAWWQVKITRPEPIMGAPLPIFADSPLAVEERLSQSAGSPERRLPSQSGHPDVHANAIHRSCACCARHPGKIAGARGRHASAQDHPLQMEQVERVANCEAQSFCAGTQGLDRQRVAQLRRCCPHPLR